MCIFASAVSTCLCLSMHLIDFNIVDSVQDGAESGYGAKAQEVLGQVRGRCVLICFLYLAFIVLAGA